jgi:hypothetical protein
MGGHAAYTTFYRCRPKSDQTVNMKTITSLFIALTLAWILGGCKKEQSKVLDTASVSGLWVPYEFVNTTGSLDSGPFSGSSLFGVYAESVKINADGSFIPVLWSDSVNYQLKDDERGTFEIISSRNEIIFQGIWRLEFELTRFDRNELWLRDISGLRKFRRKF